MAVEILIQAYDSDDTAEAGTTTTNIKMTGHGLSVGDHIINSTRNSIPPAFDNIASRRVTAVPDVDNITVEAITDQTSGDTIKKFIHVDRVNYFSPKSLRILRQSEYRRNCTFSLIATTAYRPQAGEDLRIKEDGDVLFGGIINSVKYRRLGMTSKIRYTIYSEGYGSIPGRRTVQNSHSDTDAGTLVEYYVDNYLYEEGISKGTIDAGATIEVYDANTKSIQEILNELAAMSGFKWYIDDDKALHFFQDDVVVVAAAHALDNNTFKDFRDVLYDETIDQYRDKQFIRGSTGSDGYLIQVTSVNATQVTERQNIEGLSGYYGNVKWNSDFDDVTNAEVAAENALKKSGMVLPSVISFDTGVVDFIPGTKLTVDLADWGISLSYYLIESVEIYDLNSIILRSRISGTRRDDSSFSTQKSDDAATFFGNLVNAAKKGEAGVSTLVPDDDGNLYSVSIFVQNEEPTRARGKSLWFNPADPSTYDIQQIAGDTTITPRGPKYIEVIGATTVNLFASVGNAGVIRKIVNAGNDLVIIDANGAETISGALTLLLFPGDAHHIPDSVEITCNGTNWEVA